MIFITFLKLSFVVNNNWFLPHLTLISSQCRLGLGCRQVGNLNAKTVRRWLMATGSKPVTDAFRHYHQKRYLEEKCTVRREIVNIAKGTMDPRHWILWLIQHLQFKAEASFEIMVKLQFGFVWQRVRKTWNNFDKYVLHFNKSKYQLWQIHIST